MTAIKTTPHPSDLDRRVQAFAQVHRRKKPNANIWFFDSPKNKFRRMAIESDLAFMNLVLLEGNLNVTGYEVSPEPITTFIEGKPRNFQPGAYVHYAHKSTEWWDFFHDERLSKRSTARHLIVSGLARAQDMRHVVASRKDIEKRKLEFDNWLTLCTAMSRCRNLVSKFEQDMLLRLAGETPALLGTLLDAPGVDQACMLATVGRCLQSGAISTELSTVLLNRESVIYWTAR